MLSGAYEHCKATQRSVKLIANISHRRIPQPNKYHKWKAANYILRDFKAS